ncbi:hypothetical protein TRAPUB_2137 [Trametes pubescens]|uniref:Transmembrane protein n=1 Tax=Trametes pubescens TaxID=154538 RepID=A0A1M2VHE3_TRAPU|nr:hypothetical protein TRAPUB_2137 [Trametes pubescens]
MFGLALAHLALSLKLTLVGFVASAGSIESVYDVLTGFAFVSPLWYFRLGIYVTQTLIGDFFMIYRLFLVCNRSHKAVDFPAMLFLLNLLCGYLALAPGPGFAFIPLSFFLFSFLCNAVCSALIMRRVLRNMNQYTSLSARLELFRKVVEAIVQSAAIYSTASFPLGITLICSPTIGFDACIGVFSSLIFTNLKDVQVAESLAASKHTIKPAESLLRNDPSLDAVHISDLEGRLGEDDHSESKYARRSRRGPFDKGSIGPVMHTDDSLGSLTDRARKTKATSDGKNQRWQGGRILCGESEKYFFARMNNRYVNGHRLHVSDSRNDEDASGQGLPGMVPKFCGISAPTLPVLGTRRILFIARPADCCNSLVVDMSRKPITAGDERSCVSAVPSIQKSVSAGPGRRRRMLRQG